MFGFENNHSTVLCTVVYIDTVNHTVITYVSHI